MNSSRPPGRSTRRSSPIAATGSAHVQRTSVETTVSNEASANGSASAGASTTSTPRRRSRARIAASVGDDDVGGGVVEGQVEAGARADLEHAAGRPGQQGAALRGHPAPLAEPEEPS